MMEFEEQERREIVERQNEDSIRQITVATGQSAQMLRAMNRIRFNASTSSLTDDRSDYLDNLAHIFVEYRQAEQAIPQRARLDRMRQQLNQCMGSDIDLSDRIARMRIPSTAQIPDP